MATEEQKEANKKEREAIEVTSSKATEQPEEKVEAKEEVVEEVEEKEEAVEVSDDKVEELEDKLEDKTLTAADRAKMEKRLQKEREKNRDLRTRLDAVEKQLAAKPIEGEKTYTQEELEAEADKRADQKAAVREFNASVNRIAESCKKLDKEFSEKVTSMVEEVGGTGSALPSIMVGILDDLPKNGGPVLMHLAENVELYEEIHQLNPIKMALKLKDISDDIIAKEKKAKQKEISKVPEPKDKVAGKGTTPEQRASEKDSMQDFVRKRNAEVEARRKEKAGLH